MNEKEVKELYKFGEYLKANIQKEDLSGIGKFIIFDIIKQSIDDYIKPEIRDHLKP